jgi:hypothetical protein
MIYMYLDSSLIGGSYAETVDSVENEFDRLYKMNPFGQLEEKSALARRLGKLLGLNELGADSSLGRTKRYVEEIKAKLTVEEKLSKLIDYQRHRDSTGSFECIELAAQETRATIPHPVLTHEYFNMPQFYEGQHSEALAYQSGFVDFELDPSPGVKLGASKWGNRSKAFISGPRPRVVVSANLSKFHNLRYGKLPPDSPEATFFHQLGGKHVPLHVYGNLMREREVYHRIKPLAIWR